jgi:hypothetical protein
MSFDLVAFLGALGSILIGIFSLMLWIERSYPLKARIGAIIAALFCIGLLVWSFCADKQPRRAKSIEAWPIYRMHDVDWLIYEKDGHTFPINLNKKFGRRFTTYEDLKEAGEEGFGDLVTVSVSSEGPYLGLYFKEEIKFTIKGQEAPDWELEETSDELKQLMKWDAPHAIIRSLGKEVIEKDEMIEELKGIIKEDSLRDE